MKTVVTICLVFGGFMQDGYWYNNVVVKDVYSDSCKVVLYRFDLIHLDSNISPSGDTVDMERKWWNGGRDTIIIKKNSD